MRKITSHYNFIDRLKNFESIELILKFSLFKLMDLKYSEKFSVQNL